MERIDISEDGRFAGWMEAIERGEDVVFVRDGVDIATVKPLDNPASRPIIDLEKLADLHSRLGKLRGGGAALIRQIRDEERF
ncbi:hypothetical protein [Sphingomonas sp. PB4P5]|uniref:hypothetical protein n=1 Tax=Parasphingomonas puruogangriensis TaxID=3096155 RepID=UPI002FCC2EA3